MQTYCRHSKTPSSMIHILSMLPPAHDIHGRASSMLLVARYELHGPGLHVSDWDMPLTPQFPRVARYEGRVKHPSQCVGLHRHLIGQAMSATSTSKAASTIKHPPIAWPSSRGPYPVSLLNLHIASVATWTKRQKEACRSLKSVDESASPEARDCARQQDGEPVVKNKNTTINSN